MFGATGCFQCHRFAGEGGAVGPDLTQVAGRFSPRDLLEAIIEPSKTVSDLYGNVVITRRDGESLTGRIVYHLQDDSVMVGPDMFNPAETVTVDRKDILSIEPRRSRPCRTDCCRRSRRTKCSTCSRISLPAGGSGQMPARR
ncbi:MAG: c-type cytochrome [Betaproteobacteria bacterium]|nr:c-type cytochrome [Betaproteobacteria bacterium]